MPTAIKLGVNCVFVAILTIGGVFAFVSLPEFTLKPLYWASEQFERSGYLVFFFFHSVFWWALIGGIAVFGMLHLKPRRVILYGLASATAFILFGQSWSLDSQAIWYVRELIFAATIPLLYWMFVHLARKRHNTPLNSDASDAGTAKPKRRAPERGIH